MIVLSSFICCVCVSKLNRVKCAASGARVLLPPLASFQAENKREIQSTFFFPAHFVRSPSSIFPLFFRVFFFFVLRFVLGAIRFACGTLHRLDSATICLHYLLDCTVYLTSSTPLTLSTPFSRFSFGFYVLFFFFWVAFSSPFLRSHLVLCAEHWQQKNTFV